MDTFWLYTTACKLLTLRRFPGLHKKAERVLAGDLEYLVYLLVESGCKELS
jgi:hypothetical protein